MDKVKAGIIGLGFMGTTHYGIYSHLKNVEVVAVADADPDKRRGDISKVFANIGGGDNSIPLDFSNIRVFESGMELINDPEIDVIDICVPTPGHKELLIAALNKGKHVFCEKPLCRNLDELKEIEAAVKNARGYFNVGMCVRAWPEYYHAHELYKSGAAGKVHSCVFRRLSPNLDGKAWDNWFMDDKRSGGALLDLHLHDADLVCYFFGMPRTVSTFGVRGVCSQNGFDHVVSRYDFANNTLIMAEGGWAAAGSVPFDMSFQIICEKATLCLNAGGYKVHWNNGKVEEPALNADELPTGWHRELSYFIDCVTNGVTPDKYQTPQQIFDSFKVIMAEMESAENNGQPVEVK